MEFTCRFRVGMAAVDAAGRIFFPELFRLAQECAEAFLESRGLVLADWMTDGTHLLPVVHAEADYLRPIRLGDRLEA
ncbi:MAG: acyl-CoA thioesterase, partial [Gammaproteobacteria bacterium]